jgi:hypothetical protein
MEGIAAGGNFNSGANGHGARPQVIDPPGIELNQLWLGWKGTRANIALGRQRLLFDNQRWVGNSGWRQNEQTFDALALEFAPRKELSRCAMPSSIACIGSMATGRATRWRANARCPRTC